VTLSGARAKLEFFHIFSSTTAKESQPQRYAVNRCKPTYTVCQNFCDCPVISQHQPAKKLGRAQPHPPNNWPLARFDQCLCQELDAKRCAKMAGIIGECH
jgi:hypothetical protein